MNKKIFSLFFLLLFTLPLSAKAADNCFCWYFRDENMTDRYCVSSNLPSLPYCEQDCAGEQALSDQIFERCIFTDSAEEKDAVMCALSPRTSAEAEKLCDQNPKNASPALTSGTTTKDYIAPVLNVNIPTVSFSKILAEGGYIEVNWLSEYITGLYKFLLGFAAIFAVLMLMIGGLQYVAAPGGSGATAAKKRITNAVTGMVLLFCVYLILYTVNPKMTVFDGLKIKTIDPMIFAITYEDGDMSGSVSGATPPSSSKIICPKNTNSFTLKQIAESFYGHVSYRMGGKGKTPPPEYPDSHTWDCDSTGKTTCKDFCPEGNMCFDCSGFANYVRECAGLAQGPYPTFNPQSEIITSCDAKNQTVNGIKLKPGDFWGWGKGQNPKDCKTDEKGNKVCGAHILIYIGDGAIAESTPGKDGRKTGNAIKTSSLASQCTNMIGLRILRVK